MQISGMPVQSSFLLAFVSKFDCIIKAPLPLIENNLSFGFSSILIFFLLYGKINVLINDCSVMLLRNMPTLAF